MPQNLFPDPGAVRGQLAHILDSGVFAHAQRSQRFLRYIVERSLTQPTLPAKEYSIAVDVFDRDASYDPNVDATVRVEAGRLRSRLREYYAAEGRSDRLTIEMPKGSYRAVFRERQPEAPPFTAPQPAVASAPLEQPPRRLPPDGPRPAAARPLRWAVPVSFLLGALAGFLVAK